MGPMSKQRYSSRPSDEEKLGLQRRLIFRKRKSAVEIDPKEGWSGIEAEGEVE